MSEKIESRKDVRNVAVVFGNYVINTPILLFAIMVYHFQKALLKNLLEKI